MAVLLDDSQPRTSISQKSSMTSIASVRDGKRFLYRFSKDLYLFVIKCVILYEAFIVKRGSYCLLTTPSSATNPLGQGRFHVSVAEEIVCVHRYRFQSHMKYTRSACWGRFATALKYESSKRLYEVIKSNGSPIGRAGQKAHLKYRRT